MILLSQWYEPEDPSRLGELVKVRRENEPLFRETLYLDGREKRWEFADFFAVATEKYPGEVCVVANSDILFDAQSASQIKTACEQNRLLALTRWEDPTSPNMLGHFVGAANMAGHYRFFSGTQDAWAFIGGGLPELLSPVPLGCPGCDNVIAGWAAAAGCQVFDPALDIKTWHIHSQQTRPARDPVYGLYGYPELTTVHITGVVACHSWPLPPGSTAVDWELKRTWQP
jgi:hypothetical protein